VLVPFVFVFAPSMLIVVNGFTWSEFFVATIGCLLGITFLASALSNYFLRPMRTWERLLFAFSAILMIVPGIISTATGLVLVIPVLLRQVAAMRRSAAAA
jgi:TRAP-type uncharacterized transport system fused permease subunit